MPHVNSSKNGFRRANATDHLSMRGAVSYLRRAHPTATALNVQAVTGISASTIENWLRGSSGIRAEHLCRLIAVYGPDFLAEAVPLTARWTRKEAVRDELRSAIEQLHGAVAKVQQFSDTAA